MKIGEWKIMHTSKSTLIKYIDRDVNSKANFALRFPANWEAYFVYKDKNKRKKW